MFRNLKIRSKMALVVLLPLFALALVSFAGLRALDQVQIGSKQYDAIVESKDLVADILPPPAYLIEAHLAAAELMNATDVAERESLIAELGKFKAEYFFRQEFWRSKLTSPSEAQELNALEDAYTAGTKFWQIVDEQLIPAARKGDLVATAQIDDQELNPTFETHKAFINATVNLATSRQAALEREAADNVSYQKYLALAIIGLLGALTLLVTYLVARSVIRPIRRLTTAAQQAEAQLPAAVSRAQAGEEAVINQVDVADAPDFASLATAMTSMQSTAVGLATEQARIRRNVSIMLGNLARRNQSLVNRTLSFITELEKDERNPETLENLFKLDHLTTRMRRNAESLLVLSGAEQARTWPRPVEIREVLRASLSEIEAYDRVELGSLHPALIRGSSVADLTHLVAELLDNATRFSPVDSTVTVWGEQSGDGYLLTIIDRGMGMSPDAIAAANRELESLSRLEERTSLVLGLAVVGRLGARNGIAVRLEQSASDGVTAKVRLPGSVLHRSASEQGAPSANAPIAGRLSPTRERTPAALPPRAAAEPSPAFAPPADRQQVEPPQRVPAGAGSAHASEAGAAAGLNGTNGATYEMRPTTERRFNPVSQAGAQASGPAPYQSRRIPVEPPVAAAERPARPAATNEPAPSQPAAPAAEPTSSGLTRRVPGANLFDGALPPPMPAPPSRRSAESVRDALSNFQDGYKRAPRRLMPETDDEIKDES